MTREADEPESSERLVLWHRAVASAQDPGERAFHSRIATRLEVAGATLLARVGGSVACSFDPLELDDVIDLALGLLSDARNEAPRLEVACALAIGELARPDDDRAPFGAAIDRAALLANRADAGELVLDEACATRAQATYLFARKAVHGIPDARVLDAQHPRKRDCRRALADLHPPPLPPGAREVFERVVSEVSRPGPLRVLVRAAMPYVALDRLERLQQALKPSLLLRLGRIASGLQPLGSLTLALQRAESDLTRLALGDADGIAELSRGSAIERGRVVAALRELLYAAARSGSRALLVLESPADLDPASLAVVLAALEAPTPDCVLVLLLDERTEVPHALRHGGAFVELQVEPLADSERAAVAEAMLGLDHGSLIAHRIARLGGDTVLGIAEATRTLVASGDLVREGGSFRFRAQPRSTAQALPIDALIGERVAGLDAHAARVLDVICIAPPASPLPRIERVAELDGLSPNAFAQGLQALRLEGLLDERGQLGAREQVLRTAVRNGLPAPRAGELHRFVADTLKRESPDAGPSFAHALFAYHLAEGGREADAAQALLDAAQAATEQGFPRMAVRLAAVARKLDGSSAVAARARSLVGRLENPAIGTLPPDAEVTRAVPAASNAGGQAQDPHALASAAIRAATSAIARGAFDSAEGLIDTAVAAGWDRAAAQRLSSMLHLRRGQLPEAVRALKQSHVPEAPSRVRCREAVAAALILLESDSALDALRAALEALAHARRGEDVRGERVALRVVAECFHALGDEVRAERVLGAVEAHA